MLDDVVLPALTLARAAVTGINIPGVEGTLNGLLELATMLSVADSMHTWKIVD
jgi:hypothetical protein